MRVTGMWLQLMGLGTVAYGLRETRKLFRLPSLIDGALAWLRTFPPFRVGRQVALGSVNIALTGNASLTGQGLVSASAKTTLEDRVAALEKKLSQTNVLIQETQRKLEEERRNRTNALDAERRTREAGDDQTHKLLQEATAGGLHLERVGVTWLFLGVTLASGSSEIVRIFGGN